MLDCAESAIDHTRTPEGIPLDRDANRERIVQFAKTVEGPITTVVYEAVRHEIVAGRLAARLPEKTTLYRWLRRTQPGANAPARESSPAMMNASRTQGVHEDDHPRVLGLDRLRDSCAAPDLASRLRDAEARMNALGALLHSHGLLEPYRNNHKRLLKWLGRSRDQHWGVVDVKRLFEEVAETVVVYSTALAAAGHKPATLARGDTVEVGAPFGAESDAGASNIAVIHGEALTVSPHDPTSMPVYATPAPERAHAEHWGALAARAPAASYGAVVGHVEPTKTEKDARMRARLLAPVLNEQMSLSECAAAWRRAFRGESVSDEVNARGIDAEYRLRFRNLSDRNLRRWRDRVLHEQQQAREAGFECTVSVARTLEHRQTSARARRKATSDVIRRAVELFTQQKNWSKAKVARHLREELGVDISERLVQSILAEELSDRERAIARGGAAAVDVMFRRRLLREAKYPNRAWIMDHSFLRHEITTPEYEGQAQDFDFEFEFVSYRSGVRKRVRGLWLSLIMDACTRRVLAIRVWDKAPNTRDTLLVLRDAIERFGVPEVFYTDNGSDLNSDLVRQALDAAGIHHVNSLPYTPQGRGKIERLFRTIKEKVLEGIEGYYGGRHGAMWGDDDLLTLEEVEARIWAGIERLVNGVRQSETKRIPIEHYESEVGARRLRHVGPALASPEAMLVLLLADYDVLNRTTGFNFAGRRYYSVHLGEVPNGARLVIHYDPAHLDVVHASILGPGGEIRYVGPAEYYDRDHEPPTFIDQQRAEAHWARENAQQYAERKMERERVARIHEQRTAGELLGTSAADAAAREHRHICAPPTFEALPPSTSTDGEPSLNQPSRTRESVIDVLDATPEVTASRDDAEQKATDPPIEELARGGEVRPTPPSDVVAVSPRRGRKNAPVIIMPWD